MIFLFFIFYFGVNYAKTSNCRVQIINYALLYKKLQIILRARLKYKNERSQAFSPAQPSPAQLILKTETMLEQHLSIENPI